MVSLHDPTEHDDVCLRAGIPSLRAENGDSPDDLVIVNG